MPSILRTTKTDPSLFHLELFCQGLLLQIDLGQESLVKEIYDHYPLFLLQEKSDHTVVVRWKSAEDLNSLSEAEQREIHGSLIVEKNFSALIEGNAVTLFCPLRVQQGFDDFFSWCRRSRHLFYKI